MERTQNNESLRDFLMRKFGATERPILSASLPESIRRQFEQMHATTLEILRATEDFCLQIPVSVQKTDISCGIVEYYLVRGYSSVDLFKDGTSFAVSRGEEEDAERYLIQITFGDEKTLRCTISEG